MLITKPHHPISHSRIPHYPISRFTMMISALSLLLGAIITVLPSSASASRLDQSDQIKAMIIQEALKSRYVSPSLALAVAETESSFRPHVVSHKGAIGVMQIMPATAKGVFSVHPDRLYQPRLNIQLGIRFLDDLIATYDGRIDLALSHYNGGSRVTHTNPPSIIPSTRGYVLKVLSRAQHYQSKWRHMMRDEPALPQLVSLVTVSNAPYDQNSQYLWQNEIKDIDFWLTRKDARAVHKPITSHSSYSQQLVTKMQQNRTRVSQWIKQNS